MSEPLTPERIADLRQWRAASREPRLPDDERKARTMEFLRRLEFAAPALLATAEEAATLRAERDKLRRLLDLACEDESEIHRRLDAVLPPDMMLTAKPLMGGRTPLCDDDGRVAQLVAEVKHWKANHEEMVRRNAALRDRPDLPADRVQAVDRLEAENARLRDLLARVQVEERWMPIDTAPKDGTPIMVLRGQWMAIAWWGKTINGHMAWCHDAGFFPSWDLPTHYRPKPLTPAEESELDALRAQNEEALVAENVKLRSLLARVKRVLPPGELYESILSVLHEETPCASETLVEAISRELRESR